MTASLQHFPLGQPVPDSVHAVCCSLPTMADVIGYEEKAPAVMAAVKFAYPRFVFHDYILRVMEDLIQRLSLPGRALYVTCSETSAQWLGEWIAPGAFVTGQTDGFFYVYFLDTDANRARAKAFLQHTGVCISSRQAEDYLVVRGLLKSKQAEAGFQSDGEVHIQHALRPLLSTDFIQLRPSGMNAFCGALEAVRAVQAARGRRVYLQLGWLYLDTMEVLKKLLADGERVIVIHDVSDRAAIEAAFEAHGDDLAAVVTEVPTNPLVRLADLDMLDELCARHEVMKIYDPSLAGITSVDVLPRCDVLVTSLTKYAASAGDVMMGALAVNPQSPWADLLWAALEGRGERPYRRDASRMAAEIDAMQEVAATVNANARAVADFLEGHPAVKRVHRIDAPQQRAVFEQVRREESSFGAIISFDLKGPLEVFYDRVRVVKGPSFGTVFTMLCPFLYLAHYEQVRTKEGRAYLRSLGLEPECVRLSVGKEPLEAILEALREGLD